MKYEIIRFNKTKEVDPDRINYCDSREEVVKFSIKKLINLSLELEDGDCRDIDVFSDMLELLFHLGEISNIPQDEIEKYAKQKLETEGGFSNLLLGTD